MNATARTAANAVCHMANYELGIINFELRIKSLAMYHLAK
jgi:hypothetical protein